MEVTGFKEINFLKMGQKASSSKFIETLYAKGHYAQKRNIKF